MWEIWDPELANVQKTLLRRFQDFSAQRLPGFPGPVVHGYVSGKSTSSNAWPHCGAQFLLNADIRDFFPSVTKTRIVNALAALGISASGAEVLGSFVTIGGRLPLGFNASPLFANLVCRTMDEKLGSIARMHGCRYTRYGDDLAISGDELPPVLDVKRAVMSEGFSLAEEKTRISKRGQGQFVTGLSICDPAQPRLPKRFKRRLRQEVYYCGKFGIDGHERWIDDPNALNRVDGRISYARGIDRAFGDKLWADWRRILIGENAWPSYSSNPNRRTAKALVVMDEAVVHVSSGDVFAICCAVIEDPADVRRRISELQTQVLTDPFISGSKSRLLAGGFHYADDSEEIRTEFIRLLAVLPVRAFVAYKTMFANDQYVWVYESLFKWLLIPRFVAADNGIVEIGYEENSQVSHERLLDAVRVLYTRAREQQSARPLLLPSLSRLSKRKETLLSIPDYVLGVFNAYAASNESGRESGLVMTRFERLRDRIRSIAAFDTGEMFSRRRPFHPW